MGVYTEKDFGDVVDENGNDLPAVPKAWLGTDLLEPGVKKKSGRRSSTADAEAKAKADEEAKAKSEAEAKDKEKADAEAKAKADATGQQK